MNASNEITYREAIDADKTGIQLLLNQEGQNPEYGPPEEYVRSHVSAIGNDVRAVVAELCGRVVGVVTFKKGKRFDIHQPPHLSGKEHGHIVEAVIHHDYRGNGVGTELVRIATEDLLKETGAVYATRHEKSHGSRRMMEKNGFEVVTTYEDSIRKEIEGSQNCCREKNICG